MSITRCWVAHEWDTLKANERQLLAFSAKNQLALVYTFFSVPKRRISYTCPKSKSCEKSQPTPSRGTVVSRQTARTKRHCAPNSGRKNPNQVTTWSQQTSGCLKVIGLNRRKREAKGQAGDRPPTSDGEPLTPGRLQWRYSHPYSLVRVFVG